LHTRDDPSRVIVTAEGNQNLVQDHVIQDGKTGSTETIRKQLRLKTVSLDQFRQPTAPQRADRSP
jgi:hypothetical protein